MDAWAPPPRGTLATAGAGAWRLLGIGGLVVAVWLLARYLMPVLVPIVVSILMATLLRPVAERLERRGAPRGLAALGAISLLLGTILLIALLLVPPFADRIGALGSNVEQGLRQVAYSVGHDIADVSRRETDRAVDQLLAQMDEHRGELLGDVVAGATLLAQGLGALILIVFLTFFLVKDADSIGEWLVGLAPQEHRDLTRRAGEGAWEGLGVYVRGVVFVATFDAVFIGIALAVVGVPLVLPLVVLTWVAAFFPIVGAIAAGAVAVLVALVTAGTGSAIAVAVAILIVQQVEGNVLYPVVVGPRLKLHPIAVLVAVLIGGTIGGVAGAFLAVPVATVLAGLLALHQEQQGAGPHVVRPTHDKDLLIRS